MNIKMILNDKKYIMTLNQVLDKTNYIFVLKNLRGGSDFIDPWYNFEQMNFALDNFDILYKHTIKLLYLGESTTYEKIECEIGKELLDNMIESKIWHCKGESIETNNLVVLLYQGLKILTEINPWYETCSKTNTDVYVGIDSLRLAENISFEKGTTVLDLCSGTGIQGMIAAKSASKVIAVEINETASKVTAFNILLNKLEEIIELRVGNLYTVLDNEKFDFIYANPPFIPMIGDVTYPVCGAGGEDGLLILNAIIDNLHIFLKAEGQAILFCQCLGDEKEIFFNDKLAKSAEKYNWRVSCIVEDKIPLEYQVNTLSHLTELFNEGLDEDGFKRKMLNIYCGLGAKYLYSLLYKIDNANKDKNRNFNTLDLCNQWNLTDMAVSKGTIEIWHNEDSFVVESEKKRIGVFDQEAVDIFNLVKNGKCVKEIAELLYDKYMEKYKKYGKPSFECQVLNSCFKMEQLGIIIRKK